MSKKSSQSPKGLRQFVDSDQQDAWLEGRAELADAGERQDSIEQRMRYAPRFQKLLRRPQAPEIFGILELYGQTRSEEHTSELQSLMRISYAVFCLQKKNTTNNHK